MPSGREWLADAGNAAAVPALSRISPEFAALSTATTAVAAGPSTISSRCDDPTRKKCVSPLWMPTDMDSRNGPTELGNSAALRSALRISTAAPAARRA